MTGRAMVSRKQTFDCFLMLHTTKTESIYGTKCLKVRYMMLIKSWGYREPLRSTFAAITLEPLRFKDKAINLEMATVWRLQPHLLLSHSPRFPLERCQRVEKLHPILQPHSSASSCYVDVTHFNFQSPRPNQRIDLLFCLSSVGPIDDQRLHMLTYHIWIRLLAVFLLEDPHPFETWRDLGN